MANWITVASADHVARGVQDGFMQVNHGKSAPLCRMFPGDRIAVYSPVQTFGLRDRLQAFTAFGHIKPGEPYRGDMGGGFNPFRRDVDWTVVQPAPIHPLLGHLALTAGKANWGAPFRFGVIKITDADMDLIAGAMGCAEHKTGHATT
ncbi:MAG: EVE domain-containing protein [Rhodobacterales bacterium]|jgi:hypothetical protein|nr:EVE domain-containing protein [Rhodobacterales bacterium]